MSRVRSNERRYGILTNDQALRCTKERASSDLAYMILCLVLCYQSVSSRNEHELVLIGYV